MEPMSTQDTKCHYVVLIGKRPGIYTDVAEARQQLEGYLDSNFIKCEDRASAIELMRSNGFVDNDIRLFRGAFKSQINFKPDPTATFDEEFRRFANTQQWTKEHTKKAKVDAIRHELIKYCLPHGVRIKLESDVDEDDDGDVYLDEEQYLEVYQAMCRTARKQSHPTIDDCLLELKAPPYVNILDIVDFLRIGGSLRTFSNWHAFKAYTLGGRTMALDYAAESDLLAPTLQDFRHGPGAVDPRVIFREHMAIRAAKRAEKERSRKRKRTSTPPVSTAELPRDLSPSVFDRAPSPSTTEVLDEQPMPTPVKTPANYVVTTPQDDKSDAEFDSDSDIFEDEDVVRMVTQSSQRPQAQVKPKQNETVDEFDSDSDVFDEVIKLEATQPELFNPRSSQKHVPATYPPAIPRQRKKPEKDNVGIISTP